MCEGCEVTAGRIAFHFPDLASGGVEKMRLALSRELIKIGYDVDLVLCRAAGEYLPQVPAGVRIVDLGASRTRNAILPLAKYLREENPSVLVSSMGATNIASILAGKMAGRVVPIFVTQHNALGEQARSVMRLQQRVMPMLYRLMLPLADGVIAVSEGVADDLSCLTRYPRDKINVLHNPAYPQDLERHISEPFSHPFFADGEPVVVAVGRLIEQKGFDVLIRAIRLVRDRRPVRLAILGVGPLQSKLRQQASSVGLANAVEFLGFQRNPLMFMKHAALVAMSSRFEGFGNVLVEAMACGTPVVSTDCRSGPAEILDQGKYGRLVAVDSERELASAIDATLIEEPERNALTGRARQFSAEIVTQRYLEVLFGRRQTVP